MRTKTTLLTAALALTLAVTAAAQDPIPLRFAPADSVLPPGSQGRLSVLIDDTMTIRTIDVNVAYDTTIVASLAGGAGTLFTSSGYQLFRGFEEPAPGQWHGYCIVLGAGLSVHGPGELFWWDFEGVAEGAAAITTVDVHLSDVDGIWYPAAVLPPTTITFGDPLSPVPTAPILEGLRLAPNPFNPRTAVGADLRLDGPVRLTVCDLRGRLVAVIFAGEAPAGPFARDWDGRDLLGRAAPGGTYVFRLESAAGVQAAKGLLLK